MASIFSSSCPQEKARRYFGTQSNSGASSCLSSGAAWLNRPGGFESMKEALKRISSPFDTVCFNGGGAHHNGRSPRREPKISTVFWECRKSTDSCHIGTSPKVTRFSAPNFGHRNASRFVGIGRDGVATIEESQKAASENQRFAARGDPDIDSLSPPSETVPKNSCRDTAEFARLPGIV
jgi:hypothetical protein